MIGSRDRIAESRAIIINLNSATAGHLRAVVGPRLGDHNHITRDYA